GRIDWGLLCRAARARPDRQAQLLFARALGIDPAHDAGAVIAHALGPEAPLLAGDALHQHRLIGAQNHGEPPFAAATAASTASSIRSNGSSRNRSLTMAIAASSLVPCMVKNSGSLGFSSSRAVITPAIITSVRANAPQKFTSRHFTRPLASTSSSAGLALV